MVYLFLDTNPDKGLAKYRDIISKDAAEMRHKIETKKNSKFFICKNCHIEFDEEHALNNSYLCPECGEVLEVKDTNPEIAAVEKDVAKLDAILAKIDIEINLVNAENEKLKMKRIKAEDLKKKKEREERKKIRDKEKKKLGKMKGKAKNKKGKKARKKR